MRPKILRIVLFITGFLSGIGTVLIAMTYPRYLREMRAARERLSTGSKIYKTDYGNIEYSIKGEGQPILSLHGAGGGYDQGFWFDRLGLGDGYKFISVSRFGFLRSPIPENASIKLQAAQYKALLDYLNIKNVIVFGASAGGPSATQFANDYPERCSALLLLSAVSRSRIPDDQEPFYVNIIHLIQKSDYIYWLITRFFQSQILSLMGISPKVYSQFTPEQEALAQEMLDIMHPMSPRYKGTINDGKMLESYHMTTDRLSAPALIIHAKDDALVSYKHAEYAHKNIKQSKLILFDAGGHGMLPQMEKVRKELSEFLKMVL